MLVGKAPHVRDCVVCLLAAGHLLTKDAPGVGKTTLDHALAYTFGQIVDSVIAPNLVQQLRAGLALPPYAPPRAMASCASAQWGRMLRHSQPNCCA